MSTVSGDRRTGSKQMRYQNEESREIDEEEEVVQPDYEHLLNVISEGFNQLIATSSHQSVASSLLRVKESYEEIINSIVENLSQQIEVLSVEIEQGNERNGQLLKENAKLERQVEATEKNTQ